MSKGIVTAFVTVLMSFVLAMSALGTAHAEYSESFGGSFNTYKKYCATAYTYSKQIQGAVKISATRSVAVHEVGGIPRLYIYPSNALKATGEKVYNPKAIPAGGNWSAVVTAKSVAGISYYAQGTAYFRESGGIGYYSRDTGKTGSVKHVN